MDLSMPRQSDCSYANIVKLKGLPFKATTEDVARFFGGRPLHSDLGVLFKRHPDERPNGEAFVVFEGPEHARNATKKDREVFGERFGERYVRVYPTLESDLPEIALAIMQSQSSYTTQGQNPNPVMDSVVKVKSLPFDASQLDVIKFFKDYQLKPNGVQIVVRSNNQPTGEAFVDFVCPEEALKAVQEKDHNIFAEKFGSRYVRLIQVTRKEMHATLALRFGGEGILKMKGIPFKATPQDVRWFFSEYHIKPGGISFIMHADGRHTGMAFIEFGSPRESLRALEKDRAKFAPQYGDRFCMLHLVGRYEMDKVTLQKEVESHPHPMLGNPNLLQAAALQSTLLSNPAVLNNLLLANNPYLDQLLLAASGGLLNQGFGMAPPPGQMQPGIRPMGNNSLEAMLSQQLNFNNFSSLGLPGFGMNQPYLGQQAYPQMPPTSGPDISTMTSLILAAQAAAQAAAVSPPDQSIIFPMSEALQTNWDEPAISSARDVLPHALPSGWTEHTPSSHHVVASTPLAF
eukprot:gene9763-7638_t